MMQHSPFQDADDSYLHKKRKLSFGSEDNRENHLPHTCSHNTVVMPDHRFIHLYKKDSESIYQTENWQPTGSSIFTPLTEDIMVNTRNIEQFSCTRGNFCVAGEDGLYAKTLPGHVLHLWRYNLNTNKIFISRSFLFRNHQDFGEVQQALQRL